MRKVVQLKSQLIAYVQHRETAEEQHVGGSARRGLSSHQLTCPIQRASAGDFADRINAISLALEMSDLELDQVY